MDHAGLPVPRGYVQNSANMPGGGTLALRALLVLDRRPSAIVAATDVVAVWVLQGAFEAEIGVPGDLSITGSDDIPLAAYTVPALTTLRNGDREPVDRLIRG